ncbi:putative GTPase activating protein for Arf-domain-containing protein [Lipomyces kononenkoae]|uniref:GTPase activating protein for Arf-domain-containing protein n=1 Tax=Lipomyces kononenkoae TaxID=34357 RepID=A0ACC3T2S7_LIPKO
MATRKQEKAAFERSQSILKALLKEPGNKFCSDCKKNAYPRWASWNIGVFICIRCSGIHRSMGTHISRVKSIDLDSWTNEQLQSMVRWGNVKANKYWEAKLEKGHQPLDTKMENFIRTKYELKRWCAPGPVPDPDSISDTERDDSEPERPTPTRISAVPTTKKYANSPSAISSESYKKAPELIGSVTERPASAPPARVHLANNNNNTQHTTSVKGSSTIRLRPEPQPAAKPSDDLLSLGFSGTPTTTTTANGGAKAIPAGPSQTANLRPDLKSSILSLYSQPRPQPVLPQGFSAGVAGPSPSQHVEPQQQQQQPQMTRANSIDAIGNTNGSDLTNSFAALSFSATTSSTTAAATTISTPTPTPAADPFASLVSPNAWSTPSTTTLSSMTLPSASSSLTRPIVTLDSDLDNEFGSFSSAALEPSATSTASSATIDTFASLSSFANPSFANPVDLFDGFGESTTDTTTRPAAITKKSEDDMFSNVWD